MEMAISCLNISFLHKSTLNVLLQVFLNSQKERNKEHKKQGRRGNKKIKVYKEKKKERKGKKIYSQNWKEEESKLM